MAPAGRDAVKLSDTAGRRTTPSVPAHCAARPFVSHCPAAGLAGRPIPAPGRVSQAQTRLSGTQSAPTIDASLGLRGLNFLSVTPASSTTNARCETVADRPAFCDSFRRRVKPWGFARSSSRPRMCWRRPSMTSCRFCPAERMQTVPVRLRVKNPRNDDAELMARMGGSPEGEGVWERPK